MTPQSHLPSEQFNGASLLQAIAARTVANGVVITDRAGTIVWVNPAFTGLTGYSHDEAVGRNPRFLKSGRHDVKFYRSLWKTILAGETWRGEFVNRRKDGTLFYDEHTITPVKSEQGEVTHFIGVLHDVTERKQLEQSYREAQKMESIGQLAGGVAHDFNNLLTVIQGHASLLVELAAESPVKECANEIFLAAERAANLTRQLLTFSRRQVVEMRPLDLNALIDGMVKMLHRILSESITIEIQHGPIPPIHADSGMIEQILMNLAINARDAMPRGGRLTFCTSVENLNADQLGNPEAGPGAFVRLSVTDTGCGIAPEHHTKIFEPFFTTKEIGKGTGLGLATVYGIAKQHRGWITFQSEVGRGTTFHIFFPATTAAVADAGQVAGAQEPGRGSEVILLVEDEPAVRAVARGILESCGYRVVEADCGASALQTWSARPFKIDLLLTDVMMPGGITGRELAEILSRQDPNLRCLFTSGYPAEILGKDFRLRDHINYLRKPYAPRALLQAVRQALDGHHTG